MPDCYLVVGLGNPSTAYENSRHNLGFMIIDRLIHGFRDTHAVEFELATVTRARVGLAEAILAKPLTYMNRSGLAVSALINRFDLSLSKLLVVLDDFNLPFGRLRFRPRGSDGGHRGLQSIIDELKSIDFPRLRVGIGKDDETDTVDYVLSGFDEAEKELLPEVVERSVQGCLSFIQQGISKTMNEYN